MKRGGRNIKTIQHNNLNCKNCGAEVSHAYNHKCEYCGGMLDFNAPEENTIRVKPEDLVEVSLREVMIEPKTNRIVMVFSGYKLEQPKVYEYDGNETYVSKVENYINPPKCFICIELEKKLLEEYGMGYVRNAIASSGIRYNELDRVFKQVIENKELRFFGGYR